MSTPRLLLTQREAAACGVSRTTIRRRQEAGEPPGAVLDDDRGWLIPVEDLLAAGFRLNAPAPPDTDTTDGKAVNTQAPAGTRQDTAPDETATALQAELERLRHEHALALAQEQHARALAEARHLEERLQERAAHIEDLQRAPAALTPRPRTARLSPILHSRSRQPSCPHRLLPLQRPRGPGRAPPQASDAAGGSAATDTTWLRARHPL